MSRSREPSKGGEQTAQLPTLRCPAQRRRILLPAMRRIPSRSQTDRRGSKNTERRVPTHARARVLRRRRRSMGRHLRRDLPSRTGNPLVPQLVLARDPLPNRNNDRRRRPSHLRPQIAHLLWIPKDHESTDRFWAPHTETR